MKISSALIGSLVLAISALAQVPAPSVNPTQPAPKTAAEKAAADKAAADKAKAAKTAPKTAPKAAPAAKAAPDPKAAAKKDEAPGKIEGFEIARGERGFLGLQIVNSTFKLSFYDSKKKLVAPDVATAILRWNVSYQKQPERVLLVPSDKALTSERTIKPPYSFRVSISLFKEPLTGGDGSDAGAETFSVDFSQ